MKLKRFNAYDSRGGSTGAELVVALHNTLSNNEYREQKKANVIESVSCMALIMMVAMEDDNNANC